MAESTRTPHVGLWPVPTTWADPASLMPIASPASGRRRAGTQEDVEDIDFGPLDDRPHRLIGVFPDRAAADRVRSELEAAGVDRRSIRIDDPRDETSSLRSEMREELEHSVVGAGIAGPYPKEMTRGGLLLALIGAVIGAIIATPFFLIPVDDLAWWARLLLVVGIGALAGAIVGGVVGAPLAAKGPADAVAAQRGITVGVARSDVVVHRIMSRNHPVRVDLVDWDFSPIEVEETDESSAPPGQAMRRNLDADDYVREDAPAHDPPNGPTSG